jgi:hypothetical protein
MPKFIEVYVTATGRKQWVPAHFLDHPVLGAGIKLPPSQRDKELPEGDPAESWTRAQLDSYALGLGLGTTDLATKADVLGAIAEHQAGIEAHQVPDAAALAADTTTQTTDGTESSDETPA